MTRSTKQWQRNTEGLRANAQKKAAATEQRAEAAITLLLKEQRPINFKTVAQTAGISTAWLYEHEAIKERIMHLRLQQAPKAQIKIPPREQASSASKDAMIAALRQRIQKLEQENRDLKRQVEVIGGLLYQQASATVQSERDD
jgi:predicted DNA-binding transcriptional regulator AlpA